jgi:hypothetical protein
VNLLSVELKKNVEQVLFILICFSNKFKTNKGEKITDYQNNRMRGNFSPLENIIILKCVCEGDYNIYTLPGMRFADHSFHLHVPFGLAIRSSVLPAGFSNETRKINFGIWISA